MNNENSNIFWAIIELFGHNVMAGQVSKCEIGDFIQINVPEVDGIPAWTKMVNPKAIYAITPVTEDVAMDKARYLKSMPIDRWDTETLITNRFREMVNDGKIKELTPQSSNPNHQPDDEGYYENQDDLE